ncbi:hypothetical protein HDU88_006233 [Geranomyces variabilis]|nr:hypothetical protein HDU88_006233 [Geranomyces variabilis]
MSNYSVSVGLKTDDLLDEVYSLYTAPNSATQQIVFDSRYAPSAVFEDPLMRVATDSDRKAQFASLPTIFSRIEIERNKGDARIESVTPREAARDGTGDSTNLVRIVAPNTQIYYLPGVLGFAPKIPIHGQTRLTIDKGTGRIIKHQDVWSFCGENWPGAIPIVGSLAAGVYSVVKGPVGKGASLVLRGMNSFGLLK